MFAYDESSVALLLALLSNDRLESYRSGAAPSSDSRSTLTLYVWNAGFAGAVFAPLHVVEVAFRNAIDTRMTEIFATRPWYADWDFKALAPSLVGDLVDAARRLVRDGKPVDHPHMVAALHFGFWNPTDQEGTGRELHAAALECRSV